MDSGLHTASSPAVVNGVVYTVSDTDNKVYALNAATGKPLWSYQTSNNTWSSPALANGIVYIGASDGNVYALNAATGDLLWKYTTGRCKSFSSPAVADGAVYIGSRDGNLYALNASTGAPLWKYRTLGPVDASPGSGHRHRVLRGGLSDNTLYALDASTGARIWKVTSVMEASILPLPWLTASCTSAAKAAICMPSTPRREWSFGGRRTIARRLWSLPNRGQWRGVHGP